MIDGSQEKKKPKKRISKKNHVKIYLAGTISEEKYREDSKNYCEQISKKIELIDPMEQSFQNDGHIAIVENDKKLIIFSDILVAYIKKWTCGTIMEIIFAWEFRKPVYIISEENTQFRTCNWIKYHTTEAFESVEDCFDFIKEKHLK